MPAPRPWSFSTLDNFMTCPRQYYYKYVLKAYSEPETEAQRWGTEVHKHFENYVKHGTALPTSLVEHDAYLAKARNRPGETHAEQKVALTIKLKPTTYFADDVWWRGIIDYRNIDGTTQHIIDYKTGKMKPKPMQLHMAMLYAFAQGADLCKAEFYWTQVRAVTPIVFPRSHGPAIFRGLMPTLLEYAEAWKKDIWQPRPSGLCKNYCGVKDCEYHGIGKSR